MQPVSWLGRVKNCDEDVLDLDAKAADATSEHSGNDRGAGNMDPVKSNADKGGRVSMSSVASNVSGISNLAKATVPLCSFAWAVSMASIILLPNVYITVFKGDAKFIGLLTLLQIPYQFKLSPQIGLLSDRGFFNKGPFEDVQSWGRNCPLLLISMPLLIVGSLLSWIGVDQVPREYSFVVALWFGVAEFIGATGAIMMDIAVSAGFTELFPSKAERINIAGAKFVVIIFGFIIGQAGIGSTAVGVDPDEVGTTRQRVMFACFGIITASVWLLCIPMACVLRRSVQKKIEVEEEASFFAIWEAIKESMALRCWLCSLHFFYAGFGLTFPVLPFYCSIVLDIHDTDMTRFVQLVTIGTVLILPVAGPAILRISKKSDPSRLAGCVMCIAVLMGGCHAHAHWGLAGNYGHQLLQFVIFCGAIMGTIYMTLSVCLQALFTWVIDDDQVRRAEEAGVLSKEGVLTGEVPNRRDGLFNGAKTVAALTGSIYVGVFQVLLGVFGYDPDLDEQPKRVKDFVLITYIAVLPCTFILAGVPMIIFPLKGAKLRKLKRSFNTLYASLSDENQENPAL